MNKALLNPAIRDNLESTGNFIPKAMNLEELASLYTAEIGRYKAIAKSINLEPH